MTSSDEVAAAADAVADDQRRDARTARDSQRARDRGVSYPRVTSMLRAPGHPDTADDRAGR